MHYACKVAVIDKKLFPELEQRFYAVPDSGKCPCCCKGDEFVFHRNAGADDYWHMGGGTLVKSVVPDEDFAKSPGTAHAGAKGVPFCSEARDAISRCIYTALQGGGIMHGWMNDERVMIACCNDGTRPVILKTGRLDIEDGKWSRAWRVLPPGSTCGPQGSRTFLTQGLSRRRDPARRGPGFFPRIFVLSVARHFGNG